MGKLNAVDLTGVTVQTTDATATVAAWFDTEPSKVYLMESEVIAIDEALDQGAGYVIRSAYVTDANGVVTLLGSVNADATFETDAAWTATHDISSGTTGAAAGTGPYIRVLVTGEAAKTVNWRVATTIRRVGKAALRT